MVRAFYFNFELREGNILYLSVKSIKISLVVKQLGEILKAPYVGVELQHNFVSSWKIYNKNDFYYGISRITKEEIQNKRKNVVGGVKLSRPV